MFVTIEELQNDTELLEKKLREWEMRLHHYKVRGAKSGATVHQHANTLAVIQNLITLARKRGEITQEHWDVMMRKLKEAARLSR